MEIRLNGKDENINKKTSIRQLLKEKGKSPAEVIVVYNGQILNRKKWDETILKDQDDLEVLRFVGGG